MSSRNHTEVEVPKLEEIAIAVALVAAGSPLRLMTRGWDEAGLKPGLPPTTSVVEVRMPVGLLSHVWMRVGISSFVELVWPDHFGRACKGVGRSLARTPSLTECHWEGAPGGDSPNHSRLGGR